MPPTIVIALKCSYLLMHFVQTNHKVIPPLPVEDMPKPVCKMTASLFLHAGHSSVLRVLGSVGSFTNSPQSMLLSIPLQTLVIVVARKTFWQILYRFCIHSIAFFRQPLYACIFCKQTPTFFRLCFRVDTTCCCCMLKERLVRLPLGAKPHTQF